MTPPRDRVRTKIVCTIGPASRDLDTLRTLLREGMNVARVNYSHGAQIEHAETIAALRCAAEAEGVTLAILADLQGPKIRLGSLAHPVDVGVGEQWTLVDQPDAEGTSAILPLPHAELLGALKPGSRLLFDDGAVEGVVRLVGCGQVEMEIVVGGRLSSRKGVAAPGTRLALASMTDKDRGDAAHAVSCGADFVALSFVQSG